MNCILSLPIEILFNIIDYTHLSDLDVLQLVSVYFYHTIYSPHNPILLRFVIQPIPKYNHTLHELLLDLNLLPNNYYNYYIKHLIKSNQILELTSFLINHPLKINAQVFQFACFCNNIRIVELLLTQYHPDENDFNFCCKYGRIEIIEILINYGILPNEKAILEVANFSNPHLVKYLINNDVPIDLNTLKYVCRHGNINVYKLLEKYSIPLQKNELIIESIKNSNLGIFYYLVSKYRIAIKSYHNRFTLLKKAIKYGHNTFFKKYYCYYGSNKLIDFAVKYCNFDIFVFINTKNEVMTLKSYYTLCNMGSLNYIGQLKYIFYNHYENILNYVAYRGHFSMFKYLFYIRYKFNDYILINTNELTPVNIFTTPIDNACHSGNIKLIDFVFNNCQFYSHAFEIIIDNDDINGFHYLINKNFLINDNHLFAIIHKEKVSIIKYLLINDIVVPSCSEMYKILEIKNYELSLIIYQKYLLKALSCHPHSLISNIIYHGQLKYLVKILSLGYVLTPYECELVVKYGHFHILQYLVKIGTLLPPDILSFALNASINDNYSKIIEYLISLNFKIKDESQIKCHVASQICQLGSLQLVKILINLNIEFKNYCTNILCHFGYTDIVKYLYDQKLISLEINNLYVAIVQGHIELVQFLVNTNMALDIETTYYKAIESLLLYKDILN